MEDQISSAETAAIDNTISLLEQAITEARMALIAKNASGFADSLERTERLTNAAALGLGRTRRAHIAAQKLFKRSESSL